MNKTNLLACKIFHDLNEGKTDSNIFLSPYSIYMALTMLLEGASDATKEEVVKALGFEFTSDPLELKEAIWNVSNSFWHRNGCVINSAFLEILAIKYQADIFEKDFANSETVNEINDWVDKKTSGKIKDIIDHLDPSYVAILMNAVYFKGKWAEQFDAKDTRLDTFYTIDGKETKVSMMKIEDDFKYFTDQETGIQAVEIPYKGNDVSMVIVMPMQPEPLGEGEAVLKGLRNVCFNELNGAINIGETRTVALTDPKQLKSIKLWERDGYVKVISSHFDEKVEKEKSPNQTFFSTITEDKINEWFTKLDKCYCGKIVLRMPKYKFEDNMELSGILNNIGLKKIFQAGNLTKIADAIYVSRVLHKSFIEVDEEGTEAAAVTAMMMRCLAISRTVEFAVNRAFAFFIRHKETNTVMFMGKIGKI